MEKVFKTPHGTFVMDVERDAKISRIFSDGRYIHQEILDLLPFVMERGGVAIDIGAHVGTLAIPFAQYAGKVIAFEPGPETFAFLQKNIALNASSVEARNKGLGATPGRAATLTMNSGNAAANTLSLDGGDIEIATLDDEVESADFVKLDVEGMELGVLQGGIRLLREIQPPILFEVNLFALRAHGTEPRQLEQFLRPFGYQLFYPFTHYGQLALGRMPSLTLFVLFFAPRAFLFRGPSAPFDILALPKGHTQSRLLPQISSLRMLGILIGKNIVHKWHRFLSYVGMRTQQV